MRGITVQKQAVVNLTADQWELYTASKNCTTAAQEINQAIEDAFNAGATRKDTSTAALKKMREWQEYGAMDSEPIRKLADVLDELYGEGR